MTDERHIYTDGHSLAVTVTEIAELQRRGLVEPHPGVGADGIVPGDARLTATATWEDVDEALVDSGSPGMLDDEPEARGLTVHVVAFRHKVPGEGVGGFEWDVDPEQARSRIRAAGVYDDPNYETVEYTYDTGELTLADKDEITNRIDLDAWVEDGR